MVIADYLTQHSRIAAALEMELAYHDNKRVGLVARLEDAKAKAKAEREALEAEQPKHVALEG